MKTDWNYTDRASTYDKRADYSHKAVNELLQKTGCSPDKSVVDIGAGTGKLSKILSDPPYKNPNSNDLS